MKKLTTYLLISMSVFGMAKAQWNTDATNIVLSPESTSSIEAVKTAGIPSENLYIGSLIYSSESFDYNFVIRNVGPDCQQLFGENGINLLENLGNPKSVGGWDMTVDNDNNLILCVPVPVSPDSQWDSAPRLFKFNKEGKSLWGEEGVQIPVPGGKAERQTLYEFGDSYYVSYSKMDYSINQTVEWLMRVSEEGQLLWEEPLEIPGGSAGFYEIPNGFIAVYLNASKAYAIAYDFNGTKLWDTPVALCDQLFLTAPYFGNLFFGCSDTNGVYVTFNAHQENSSDQGYIAGINFDGTLMFENGVIRYSDTPLLSVSLVTNPIKEGVYVIYANGNYGEYSLNADFINVNGNIESSNASFETAAYSLGVINTTYTDSDNIIVTYSKTEGWSGSDILVTSLSSSLEPDWTETVIQPIYAGTDGVSVTHDSNATYIVYSDIDVESYPTITWISGIRIYNDGKYDSDFNGIFKVEDDSITQQDLKSGEYRIYNITGQQVQYSDQLSGLYIVSNGKKSQKIFIR